MTPQTEALELVLDALVAFNGQHLHIGGWIDFDNEITAIKEALAQPDQEPVEITITGKLGNIYSFTGDYSLKKGDKVYTTPPQPVVNQSLTTEPVVTDAMVEAAVKAFFGYENSKVCRTAYRIAIKAALQEKFCDNNCVWTDHHPDCKLSQPEQEPVAWIHNFIDGGISIGKRPADLNRHPDRWIALYKEPKPCPTCEALARTVMLDQTSHDTTPPQRKPLTHEQRFDLLTKFEPHKNKWEALAILIDMVEAAHGIKE